MRSRTRVSSLAPGILVALVLGALPLALFALIALVTGSRIDTLGSIYFGAGGLAVSGAIWAAWLARRLAASRRRMSDPWYQAKLAQFAIQSSRPVAPGTGSGNLPVPTHTS